MPSQETVLQLIELIYDAAADPSRWPRFAAALSEALGGGATFLTLEPPGRMRAPAVVTHGLEASAVRQYAEYYVGIDPLQQGIGREPEGTADFGEPYVGREDLKKSEIYNDWYRPNGLGLDSLGGVVTTRGAVPSVVGAYQERGMRPYTNDHLELARVLLPHLKRALQIHYRLEERATTSAALLRALDELAFGVILLDRRGRFVAVNRMARELARQKEGIALAHGEIRGIRPAETAAIGRLVGDVLGTASGPGAGAGGSVVLRRSPPRRPLEVLVSRLHVGEGEAEAQTAAAVFVHDPDALRPAGEALLAQLYDLTPREAAVASRLSEGCTLAEAAESLGMSLNTAKVRLREVFAKTRTARQVELVRLLAPHLVHLLDPF